MPKYNIYKIQSENLSILRKKFESVGLTSRGESFIGDYRADFYFSDEPDYVDIWWIELYKDFIKIHENNLPKNKLYFGVLLLSKESNCYAISFGKSHFYLREFCDSEFGLNLAERIVDENNLRMKTSKLFGGKRNKNITSYQDGSPIEYDSGESFQYIKAKTIDEKIWGKVVSFGASVQFQLNLSPHKLNEFLDAIEKKLNDPPLFALPRVEEVKDREIIQTLDEKLVDSILSYSTETLTDEVYVSGVDFVFSENNQYSFYVKGNMSRDMIYGDLNINRLIDFVNENKIDLKKQLNQIKVRIKNEHSRLRSEPLKNVLDFVDDERYCLMNGRWYRFNQSYISYLQKEVDKIKIFNHDRLFLPKDLTEDQFNRDKVTEGFLHFDKNFTFKQKYKIEKMDLYKDNTLYFVKMGQPQNLGYVIDQSINTVRILQNNEEEIRIEGVKVNPENMCLWLILERKRTIQKLSELKSLIFLMKLVDWKRIVTSAGYTPIINIGYKEL